MTNITPALTEIWMLTETVAETPVKPLPEFGFFSDRNSAEATATAKNALLDDLYAAYLVKHAEDLEAWKVSSAEYDVQYATLIAAGFTPMMNRPYQWGQTPMDRDEWDYTSSHVKYAVVMVSAASIIA